MQGDASLSGLLCLENEAFLNEKQELVDENYSAGYDEEYLTMLFDRETNFGFRNNESLVLSNFLKNARLEAITWILKARTTFGFRFQTAYISMTYFDRFISRKFMGSAMPAPWVIQLLSIASLTLAAKMEEIKVPALSAFRTENYCFENKTIERMELLVLNTLEWKMSSITPFLFLRFFIKEMCKTSPPDHLISSIVHLIFATMKEINVFEHRPSVIAIASIFTAMNQGFTRMSSMPFCGFLGFEDVFTCYNLMQKLEIPKSINSTDLRAIETLDDSSSSDADDKK